MLPATKDLYIYQGDTFNMKVRLRQLTVDSQAGNVVDVTGAVGAAQIRTSPTSNVALATMACVVNNDFSIDLSMTATQTSGLVQGVWDFQLTWPDGSIKTYLKGNVYITQEVTRAG